MPLSFLTLLALSSQPSPPEPPLPPSFLERAKAPVEEGGLDLRGKEVGILKRLTSAREGFYYPGFHLAVPSYLRNVAQREELIIPYLRYALGLSTSLIDKKAYIEALTIASEGDSLLHAFLDKGCNLSQPYALPERWKVVVKRAVDSLLHYTMERSRPLKDGFYFGPTLEGETYAFRNVVEDEEGVAWGSPPAIIMAVKERYPYMVDFLLSNGSAAFTLPTLALAYGRLKGSGEKARFILKHYRAGRFAALTEYDVAPYEPCLPDSIYLLVARHPKVIGIMLAHTSTGSFPPLPYTLDTATIHALKREGLLVVPDWFNMNALYMLSLYQEHWGMGRRELLERAPYPYLPGLEDTLEGDLYAEVVERGEDLWNAPALLSLYFALKVVEQLHPLDVAAPVESLPYALEERLDFWHYVYEIEEEVGWQNIYLYAYSLVLHRLLALVEEANRSGAGKSEAVGQSEE